MNEQPLTVIIENVDDIPVLMAAAKRLGVAELLDKHFVAHGNWQGSRPGTMLTGWLTYILSEGDHRLNQVQDWAATRLTTLSRGLGVDVTSLDFSDDRLAAGLDLLSDDARWAAFEADLNQRTVRVYDLALSCVRIDTTTGSGYWHITPEGLFQRGHSKDHRPDLPQLKIVLATLDPLGLPVATQVVAGHRADDRLYIPAVDQVRTGLDRRGLLYIGDCKMMSLATRLHLVAGGDYYLGPFAATHISPARLDRYLAPVWADQQALTTVERQSPDGTRETIAEGYECRETLTATYADRVITWEERHLVIRSLAQARAAEAALQARLQQAQTALAALTERKPGKPVLATVEALRQAADQLLHHHQVEGLLRVEIADQLQEQPLRKYGPRPAETRREHQFHLTVQKDDPAIREALRRLGWRVYGTNGPAEVLTVEQAVLAYREEYVVERCFGRLKGHPLSLTPMYLADDHRATGLIRLLSIGLRVLTLLEHVARGHLAEQHEKLSGLYAGNPTRATARPTTEALLRAFQGIALSVVTVGGQTYRHLSPLSELQHKILALLDLPASIYAQLLDCEKPP